MQLMISSVGPGFHNRTACYTPHVFHVQSTKCVVAGHTSFCEQPHSCKQVRERMRTSKEALQKLRPIVALVAEAVNNSHTSQEEEDDRACIICLDQPSSVTFQPCSHSVTCASCAKLVMTAKQPLCPLCRARVASLQGPQGADRDVSFSHNGV